jgi:uncharacterized protein (TIGR02246 family)
MRQLIALGSLLAASPAFAATSAPGDLPASFVSAWNAHDLRAFEVLFTPDATWVPVAEERTEGREAILREFSKIHTSQGWAVHSAIALKGEPAVHMLRRDVATLFFHMDFIAEGKPVAGLQRAMILVATAKRGQWRIAAGQLTKESSR